MKAKSALIASIATVGIACSANAQNYTAPGGAVSGVHTFNLVITDTGIIADIDVTTLWASHIWAGDINASITHVDTGTTVSLFGFVGGGVFGDSSDLVGAYRFDQSSANSFWAAAAAEVTGSAPIAPGTYFPTAVGSPVAIVPGLNAFNGENIQGTWRLNITDTYPAFSTGSLTSFTVHAVVPAPGALALLGLAGVMGRRRQRN